MTEKFAVIVLPDPSDHARMFHAFLYLFDLKDSGFHSELFLEGYSDFNSIVIKNLK